MKYLTNLDLNQNELQNVVIQNLATDPENPKSGQFWFNTATKLFKFYKGDSIESFPTIASLNESLKSYQKKIEVDGLLKGDGEGGVTQAKPGEDYDYPVLKGESDPTTSTEGAVTQHYLNTTSGVEYVCTQVSDNSYTWTRVTTDVSGKQDSITESNKLPASLVDGLSKVATSNKYTDLDELPDLPEGEDTEVPNMDGVATAGTSDKFSRSDHVHPSDTSKQNKIEVSGILKGDGSGGVSQAVADEDYQSVINVDSNKALVSDENGGVTASSVTSTELSHLSGVTSNIQDQLNNIPRYNYKDSVSCTVADESQQEAINTAAIEAIESQYSSSAKWDAVVVEIKFTPSDVFKDGVYYYNGSNWVFLYYVTTGIQLASGTTAGLIQEADTDSDLSLAGGVATVNKASKLRTARTINLKGVTAEGKEFDGSSDIEIEITKVPTSLLDGVVSVENGGTGKNSISQGAVLRGTADGEFEEVQTTEQVTANSEALVTSGAVHEAIKNMGSVNKYTDASPKLTPDEGGVATWTVTHSLGTKAVNIQIFETTTYSQVMADIYHTNDNTVTIKINASEEITAGAYQVVVIG